MAAVGEVNVMLIGDTRAGKTSFVNTIAGRRDWRRVGTDNGESTTIEISECSVQINGRTFNIYDTPGMNDSQLRLSNREIQQKLEFHLSSTLATSLDAFIIFESLQSEAISLRRNLATLVNVFGPKVQESCFVLLTKEPVSLGRSRSLQNLCAELNIPFVFWENSHESEDEGDWINVESNKLQTQIANFIAKVDTVKSYEMSNLQNLKYEILQEAEKRRSDEPPTHEKISFQVDVPYMEEEVRQVTKQRPVVKKRWKNGKVGAALGIKETYVDYESYTENETIYHPRTRKETKYEQVAKPKKPIEYYVEIVKKEKVAQFRDRILREIPRDRHGL